jgi:ABC transporter substrate binding protein (PQQ-dependent alcohol dehydrogenase system)
MTTGAAIRVIGAGLVALLAFLFSIVSTGVIDARADTVPLKITIGYLAEAIPEPDPLSLVEVVPKDKGIAGVKLAMEDNNTTGKFLKQTYELTEKVIPQGGDLHQAATELVNAGIKLIIANLTADRLLELADYPEMKGAVILDMRTQDDRLRTTDCRANVFHVMPNRAMKADALAQFLVSKQWMRWVLIQGSNPDDKLFADAVRRAAKRYKGKIVEERTYTFAAGSRRSDTGQAQIRKQMTELTQRLPDYDVMIVADESEVFGDYLPYRTWDPRPVVGTQGLVPTAWHRSQEQWGGTQLQRRFTRETNRPMLERDYTGWMAARAIGESVTRINTGDPKAMRDYMLSDKFELAAFKGQGLTFRHWDQQLREPILLASPLMLVSVSPQEGFLHQRTPLDTLGYDEPDSQCKLNP